MDKRQVGIEVLLRTQFDFQIVLLTELDEHREQEQLQNFRYDLCVHGDRINPTIDVDETLDDPVSLFRRYCLCERSRMRLQTFQKSVGCHEFIFNVSSARCRSYGNVNLVSFLDELTQALPMLSPSRACSSMSLRPARLHSLAFSPEQARIASSSVIFIEKKADRYPPRPGEAFSVS